MEKFYLLLAVILGATGTWVVMTLLRDRRKYLHGDTSSTDSYEFSEPSLKAESVLLKTTEDSSNAIIMISKAYYLGISGFHSGNRKLLGEIETEIEEFNQRAKRLKANTYRVIQHLQHDSIETGHYYVQIVDYLREMAHSIKYVVRPLTEHLMDNHKPFAEDQNVEMTLFSNQVTDFLNFALHIIKESRFEQIDELIQKRHEILELMRDQEKRQIRRIKKKETNSRNSVLYFGVMSETKHMLLQTVNLLKATRDFVSYTKS
jgi:Na+/phosphate symporter